MANLGRTLAAVVAMLLLAAAVFLVPTLFGKPWKIEHYYLRVLAQFVLEHPMLLSYGRILDPYGLDFYSDDLEDLSPAATDRMADQVDEFLEGLRAYDREDQTPEQLLSTDVMAWFLETRQAGRPFRFHGYPVNQFDGVQSSLPDFMMNIHTVEDVDDAENHVARLEKVGVAFDQLIEDLRHRESLGVLPPRFVFEAVLEEIEGFVSGSAEENPVYVDFSDDLAEADGVSEAEREALLGRSKAAIAEVVVPAYRRLAEVLDDQRTRATDDDGVWKLPDGDAYYRWALRWHTSTDLSPDEVHELGLAEVARIRGAMTDAFRELGQEVEDPVAALAELAAQPGAVYEDTEGARERILEDFRAIAREAEARMPEFFGRLPEAPVSIERVPPFKETGSAAAYYNPPSFDGSRPGTFYANLRDPAEVQKLGMRTLTYHEAVPGHHLQLALAFEQEELPFFRRIIPFTAFIEGWALYAERLALEEGFHPTPEDRLGAYQAELFRAVRLVVDTGLHAKRWTRKQAFEYMVDNTGQPPVEVQAEIDRYIVMPGQACAYKIGQLQILGLRDQTREELGSRFDLRAFHDVVLGNGGLPLEVLARVVEGWVDAQP